MFIARRLRPTAFGESRLPLRHVGPLRVEDFADEAGLEVIEKCEQACSPMWLFLRDRYFSNAVVLAERGSELSGRQLGFQGIGRLLDCDLVLAQE